LRTGVSKAEAEIKREKRPREGVQMARLKTGIFIIVRLGSTRLPRKAVLDILGKPVLEHLVERLKSARSADLVVICTTQNPVDDPIVEISRNTGVQVFRGSEEDMLDRLLQAALTYHVSHFVGVEGDDLLVDPEQVDEVAKLLLEKDADLIRCEGLPFGAAPIGVKVEALSKVCRLKTETKTATGWTRYFTESGHFNIVTMRVEDPELLHPEIRMTLDYPEDYEFFKTVFEELDKTGRPIRLREAVKLIMVRPDIKEINAGLEEKYWEHFGSSLPRETSLRKQTGSSTKGGVN
jgi:spore coat polysaccharide biosynthesis protein SpsF